LLTSPLFPYTTLFRSGPNHVLPTAGTARFSSPLGVYDFQKRTSLIEISQSAAAELGRVAATLADGEGFAAHAEAARLRFRRSARCPWTPQGSSGRRSWPSAPTTCPSPRAW